MCSSLAGDFFVDIECAQIKKYSEDAFGDCFLCRKITEEDRTIAVLSDGLGSGIKANILSNMTAHMALKFIASDTDMIGAIKIMMEALPVCKVRKVSYATFTIVDYRFGEVARIIEMDNPKLIHLRGAESVGFNRRKLVSSQGNIRRIYMSEISIEPGDRLLFASDGVTQAGLGTPFFPLGWREEGLEEHVQKTVMQHPQISAAALADNVVKTAITLENNKQPYDDISCAVMFFRTPRKTLVVSGPPYDQGNDRRYAQTLDFFPGRQVICGGTTSNIISRELGREVRTDLHSGGNGIPPLGIMEGVDLITEGIITLTSVAQYLESGSIPDEKNNPAVMLCHILQDSDIIDFIIGTKINDAHQDPLLPHDLELRRSIIKRIARSLEEKYLKKVNIGYI